jgi:hypothetical protein
MSLRLGEEGVAIQLRVRRTTIEYGYVGVELTPGVIGPDNRLDWAKISQRAVEMGQEPQMIWYKKEQIVEIHPIQGPRGPGEMTLYEDQNGFEAR